MNWCEGVRLVNNRTLGHSHFRGSAVDALVHFLTLERRRSIFSMGSSANASMEKNVGSRSPPVAAYAMWSRSAAPCDAPDRCGSLNILMR
jgi:hypothetical protein